MRLAFCMKYSFFLFLFCCTTLFADPWGKDADLLVKKKSEKPAHNGVLERFAEVMIHFHQNTISEADGPRSHFEPSSSQYTLDAMQEYGFFYGFLLGCDRLMRENDDPWIYPTVACELNQKKFDPVTKRKRD